MITLLGDTTFADLGLLLAIILGTTFVYNKGSLLPKTDFSEGVLFEKPQKQDAPISVSARTRDVGQKIRESEARFVILWGSQSGTAEHLASRLGRDIQQQFKCKVIVGDLSDYDPSTLANVSQHVILTLVMSTYGEGEPSDNAQDFVSYYTSKSRSSLSHLRFAAFGCGNSSYRYFNQVIHDTASALQKCGAKAVLPVGSGDEASRSTNESFHEWKERLFSRLTSQYNLVKQDAEYHPTVHVTLEDQPDEATSDERPKTFQKGANYLPIILSQPIAQYDDPTRSCTFIKLNLARHTQLKYRTGDHIAIWPCNPVDEVNRLLCVLGRHSQRDHYLRIEPVDDLTELSVPSTATLYDLLSNSLDICAQVPRETVSALAQMASNQSVKEELKSISNSKETYSTFLRSNYVTLARLLELSLAFDADASWQLLPISFIIDHVPLIQPRLYSIASSSIVEPRQVSLVVSVKPQTVSERLDTLIHGVTSTYLSQAQLEFPNDCLVQAEIRRSSFKLPSNLHTPVIMIAAGAGIAPFRGFIQERARLASIGRAIGPMLLFFGCQSQADCLFFDDFAELSSDHVSKLDLQLHTAFSRPSANESGSPKEKTYVQDELFKQRHRVMKKLLEQDASLYVCGSTTMAKGVRDVILQAIMSLRHWSSDEAEQWRQERRKSNRWHEDVWS